MHEDVNRGVCGGEGEGREREREREREKERPAINPALKSPAGPLCPFSSLKAVFV